MPAIDQSDSELVSRSLAGDRDAFGRIVARYQTLICSLAYSRLGNLGQSQDVAQETFITAWKHLRLLRDPARLRAWLCGIVRNRIHKSLRREGREPAHNGEGLDAVHEAPAEEALPSDHAAEREEEAILWRALQNIPDIYREPLILFYRQNQSVEAVAAELDLSEDAVKQRLSRGRKLLQQEVQVIVEKTLRRTVPGRAFSNAVLAALPVGPGTSLTVGMAGKGVVAKSGLLGVWVTPLVGILGGIAAHRLIISAAPSARERRLKRTALTLLWMFILAWCLPGLMGMRALARHFEWSNAVYFPVLAGFWWLYAAVLAALGVTLFRRVLAMRGEGEATPERESRRRRITLASGVALVAGVHLAYFSWLVGLALIAHDTTWAGILAAVMLALALWNVVQLRGRTGRAAVRAVAKHQALIWGTILLILNLRLGKWVPSAIHLQPAAWRQLLPAWVLPLLTLALVGWVWLLLRIPRPGLARPDPGTPSRSAP